MLKTVGSETLPELDVQIGLSHTQPESLSEIVKLKQEEDKCTWPKIFMDGWKHSKPKFQEVGNFPACNIVDID